MSLYCVTIICHCCVILLGSRQLCSSSIYWTGSLQGVKSPMKLVRLGWGAAYALLKQTVNIKNQNINKVIVWTSGDLKMYRYGEEIKADVKARRPARKASGHVVADRLVWSLYHYLSVTGNKW